MSSWLNLEGAATWEDGAEARGAYFSDLWADAGADAAERFRELTGPEWDVLGEHTVEEAMSFDVRSVFPDTSASTALS